MTLEGSAAYVWEELAESGPIAMAVLVSGVAEAYEVADEVVRDDILGLLEQLRERGLVVG